MTSIIAIFSLSLILSLVFTPLMIRIAKRYKWVDMPSERKIHAAPMPRVGGVAIFVAFCFSFILPFFYSTIIFDLLFNESRLLYIFFGACVIFSLGLWDDIRSVNLSVKFAVQVLAAIIVYLGGIRIEAFGLPGMTAWELGWFSLPVTVFWIILLTNAINLLDGLDGLAAGVTFFVCASLVILSVMEKEFFIALLLAALGGSVLGFLKYNFNPARIFMGDCGSYFLGFMLAVLTIISVRKSQAAVTMLIPIVALGVPLLDTLLAPLRRYFTGRKVFEADDDHFHHRLLQLGLSQRNAVFIFYGITVSLALGAFILVHARSEQAALILFFGGATLIFAVRKLGYIKHLNGGSVYGWAKEIFDEVGFAQDKRDFFAHQTSMAKSEDMEQLCARLDAMSKHLQLDYLDIRLDSKDPLFRWLKGQRLTDLADDLNPSFIDLQKSVYICLPLGDVEHQIGSMTLYKESSISPQFLKRIEYLRRSVTGVLGKLVK